MSEDKKPEPLAKPPYKLAENKLQQEEYAYARMSAVVPADCSFEEILRPEFWSQVAHRFRGDITGGRRDFAGSIVVVRAVDHSFYAELYIREVQQNGLLVGVLREPVYFGPRGDIETVLFKTRWNVGKQRHEVLRRTDNEVVFESATKESAMAWIDKTSGGLGKAA